MKSFSVVFFCVCCGFCSETTFDVYSNDRILLFFPLHDRCQFSCVIFCGKVSSTTFITIFRFFLIFILCPFWLNDHRIFDDDIFDSSSRHSLNLNWGWEEWLSLSGIEADGIFCFQSYQINQLELESMKGKSVTRKQQNSIRKEPGFGRALEWSAFSPSSRCQRIISENCSIEHSDWKSNIEN